MDHLQKFIIINIIFFSTHEEGGVVVEICVYDTNNPPRKATFKYEQEGRFCIGVAKVESKEDGTITGNLFPVFDYTGNKFSQYMLTRNRSNINLQ